MKFHIITVVWGQPYTDLFINIALPNQLSPGNLSYFSRHYKKESLYKIYTTSGDVQIIKNSLAFIKLSELLPVKIILIDTFKFYTDISFNKYNILTECHKRAIYAADAERAVLIFLSPDIILSDGTFANLLKLAARGKQAVMVAGIRLVKETFIPELLRHYFSKDDWHISISSRELVKIALDHLHPVSQSVFWNSREFTVYPSHLYWKVNQEGLLARCFHLHPLMVNPSKRGISFSGTIDADYVSHACPCPEEHYVVVDSDEIACFEVSSLSHSIGIGGPNASTVKHVASWTLQNTFPEHRGFVKHRIQIHSGEISGNWQRVEQYSDRVVDRILDLIDMPEIIWNFEVVLSRIFWKIVITIGNFCKRYRYSRIVWYYLRSLVRKDEI